MRHGRGTAVRVIATLTAGATTAVLAAVVSGGGTAHAAESYPLPSTGTITVIGNGNGHGHGLSQYGARGAAMAGKTAMQIATFYYPHTTAKVLPRTTIRVLVAGTGSSLVVAASSGLQLSGMGALPTTGIQRYRLVASGTTLRLDKLAGSTWSTVKSGLPNASEFKRGANSIQVYRSDGSSVVYRGAMRGVLNNGAVVAVNRVALDDYTQGVVPREMPSSWEAAAVQAQAIAARSYGRQAVESTNGGGQWDICDSSNCQVYGGAVRYDSAGNVLWRDYPAAISGNENTVLTYGGKTIFAQFSASDGGWTVDGGQPYLVAKADPYDNAGTGDPYLHWNETPGVGDLADYYGLTRVTTLGITSRDGNGDWGGRVTAGYVRGVDSSGHSVQVNTSGFELASALGVLTNWFTIKGGTPPGAPLTVAATPGDSMLKVSWDEPTSSGTSTITGYTVKAGSSVTRVSGSARSADVIGLRNGVSTQVTVQAENSAGLGAAANATATPVAGPQRVRVLAPVRLFDTRSPHVTVDATHPFTFDFAGAGDISTSATSVQFALTILTPTESGAIRVHTTGAPNVTTAAIAYRKGQTTAATISVPTTPDSTVVFTPSSGRVALTAAQLTYTGSTLGRVGTVVAARVSTFTNMPATGGVAVPIAGHYGVPADASGVILSVLPGPATANGWLRFWADGASAATVSQVSATPDNTGANTITVPIGDSGAIRIAAQNTSINAGVSVVGYVAPLADGRGRLETFQPVGAADAAAGVGRSLRASTTSTQLVMSGKPQVPATGVQAVLLHLTVSSPSSAGALYVYPAGGPRPALVAMTYAAHGADRTTATVLVRLGAGGAISVRTTKGTAVVSVDTIGWVSTVG